MRTSKPGYKSHFFLKHVSGNLSAGCSGDDQLFACHAAAKKALVVPVLEDGNGCGQAAFLRGKKWN